VAAARALVDWFDTPGHAMGGTIRFGASPTLGPYLLPHVIAKLHAGHPDLSLFIEEAPPQSLIDGLARGDHEMVLVQLPVRNGDFTAYRLFREPLELVVARDHPFARRASVSPADLAGTVMLALGPNYSMRRQVEDLCEKFGARLRGDYQGSSLDALRLMAGMGMGITLLPALYVRSEIASRDEDVTVVKLEGPRILRSIGLVVRRSRGGNDPAQRIASLIQAIARSNFDNLLFLEENVDKVQGPT
jgi:LysR family hydrogen peroxide-inducible transcriptional activator